MGYLICSKCKGYYKLREDEHVKDLNNQCKCGGKLRYVENLDIIDPQWKPIEIAKKETKKEILTNKLRSTFTLPQLNIRNRLNNFYNNNFKNRLYNTRNQRRMNKNPYGMDANLINSLMSELNLHNLRWMIIIPMTLAVTLILTFLSGIYTLLTFLILLGVGYLIDDRIIGIKNALVTGAISYFLGGLLTGSYLYLILYIILGMINGAVCGWIGGYIRTRLNRN